MSNINIKASVYSGIAEVILTHPIDYLKTIKQSKKSNKLFWKNPYCGVSSRFTGLIPTRVVFWNILGYCKNKDFNPIKTGIIVASCQTLLDYPFEQIKIQRMINHTNVKNAFVGHTIIPGFSATLSRNIGFAIILNYAISLNDTSPIYSGIGGFMGALVTHPLDTLKTHFQYNKTFNFPKIKPIEYFNGCTYRCSISLISMGIGWSIFNYFGYNNVVTLPYKDEE